MNKIKTLMVMASFVLAGQQAFSQKTAVTEIPMNENTTISIKKGDAANKCEKLYEIVESTAEIQGEPSILSKEARNNWKKACADWKKEIKELNQENKIIALDCGKVTCAKEGGEGQVCSSQGSYKIKTKIN